MRWPYDRRVEPVHAWGLVGLGVAVLAAVPSVYATQRPGGFRWWWPTDWMALPLAFCAVGLVLLLVPVQRSRTATGERGSEDEQAHVRARVTGHVPAGRGPAVGVLPAGTTIFAGRDRELAQLLDLLDPAGGDAGAQVVAISGLAGAGKTELAVQAAHAARGRSCFPGGVLFVNLFGYDPVRRVAPDRALDGLLRALGVPRDGIPPDAADRARLYTSELTARAEGGRPVLVVIDNASSADQAEPLLPPAGAGRAVITSRHVLAELGARLIELRPLDTNNAVTMLGMKLRQANGPADTRMQDAAAAQDLAAFCGGLPLALQITGATLAADPSKSLRQMASDLDEAETRLDELRYGDRAVRTAFEFSYQALTPAQQRLFRLLTVNTGPDVSTDAAAAIAGQDQRETRRQLEILGRAHLIEGGAAGRWQMHDLVRAYAEILGRADSATDQRAEAEERLLRYYQTNARAASSLIRGRRDRPAGGPFADLSSAVSWLKAEHANLTAAVLSGADRHPAITIGIAFPLSSFLGQGRYYDEDLVVCQNTLRIARTMRSASNEARALDSLGIALHYAGREAEALAATTEAIALYRQLAAQHPDEYEPDLGRALANLAGRGASDDTTLAAAQEAVDIGRRRASAQDHADPNVELAGALNNLSHVLSRRGQHAEAVSASQEAISIRRVQAARAPYRYEPFLGEALMNLAAALAGTARPADALAAAEEGVTIFRRLAADELTARGPDLVEALGQLAAHLATADRPADAQAAADEAARIQHLIDDSNGKP